MGRQVHMAVLPPVKQLGLLVLRNAGAAVLHRQQHAALAGAQAHVHGPAPGSEFHGVGHQVPEQPGQILPVDSHGVGPFRAGKGQPQLHQLGQGLPLAAQAVQKAHQLHIFRIQRLFLCQHRRVGQIVHHPQDAVIALAQNGGTAVGVGAGVPRLLRGKASQSCVDVGQRAPQLCGDARQDLPEHLLFRFTVLHMIQPPSPVYDSGKA